MKRFFQLAFLTLCFAASIQAQPGPLEGNEILDLSTKAYRALGEYRGECAVISQATISVKGAPAQSFFQTARAGFDFKRGQSFKIEGRNTESEPFTIDNRGAKTVLTYRREGKEVTEIGKDFGLAVATMTGVAAGAPTTIPALLSEDGWGSPYQQRVAATLQGRETIAGHVCFVIIQKFAQLNRTSTFWIDSQSFLLRQMRVEGGAWKAGEDLKLAPEVRNLQLLNSSAIHVFSIEKAAP